MPSDDTRERSIQRLRRGYLLGRISTDTFERRVECAVASQNTGELERLVEDLPRGAMSRAWRALVATLQGSRSARLPDLFSVSSKTLRVGRSPDCEIVLPDECVSRFHAEVALIDGRWNLRDLGSLNGTWVNGRRLRGQIELRRGDVLTFGSVSARF